MSDVLSRSPELMFCRWRAVARCGWALLVAGLMAWLLLAARPALAADVLDLQRLPPGSLGVHTEVLMEAGPPLSLAEARAAFQAGQGRPGASEMFSFGIGARPVWLRLRLVQDSNAPQTRHLVAGATWLDWMDVWLIQGEQVQSHQTGDERVAPVGLVPGVGYVLPLQVPPGRSELLIRVASVDPLVLPIELLTPEESQRRERQFSYGYGFLYGFLLALCAYNLMLFLGLRDQNHLRYAVYLASLVLMNMSYTGHSLAWLWPGQVHGQRYLVLTSMVLFASCGLIFGARFLSLRAHSPRVFRAVQTFMALGIGAFALSVFAQNQLAAAWVAFVYTVLFTVIMVALGLRTYQLGKAAGRYFLIAALSGMVGAATTATAVLGWIPFTPSTYHLLEVGVVIEATLLALSLAHQVRSYQTAARQAERLARLDPLTGLRNRRAFMEQGEALWTASQHQVRPLSLMMVDVDFFKQINDQLGHEAGDRALVKVSKLLVAQCRAGDVLARWGGEEFVLLLPDTDLPQALQMAERLRFAVERSQPVLSNVLPPLTISIGVAEREQLPQLEALIKAADAQLYLAKQTGRNVVRPHRAELGTLGTAS